MSNYKTRDPSRGLIPAEPLNQPVFFHSLYSYIGNGVLKSFMNYRQAH